MDRLVKPDVEELELSFKTGQKCSSVFRLTNLMHTMTVAVSLTTSNPTVFSFAQPYAIVAPLSSLPCTLLSHPSDHPPLQTPRDAVTVRSAMLPTGKAQPEDLRGLFSVPGGHVFRDGEIPISIVGPQALEFLVSNRARVSDLDSSMAMVVLGCTAAQITESLARAIQTENPDLVAAVITSGANVNGRDSGGKSMFSLAIELGKIEIVKILIHSGCKIDDSVEKFLHQSARSNRVDLIEILCKNSVPIDSVDSENRTPIHIAAKYGHVEAIEYLLSMGADVDACDGRGRTALHYAAAEGHLRAVEKLLERVSAKNAVDGEGKTSFALAAENSHMELFPALRLNDALHRAARLGDDAGVRSSLAEGAAVNSRDQRGWTPLHRAAFKGQVECARVLLGSGAEADATDEAGYTPLRCAVEAGNVTLAMLLVAHGAHAGFKSMKALTPLGSGAERFMNHPTPVLQSLCCQVCAKLT